MGLTRYYRRGNRERLLPKTSGQVDISVPLCFCRRKGQVVGFYIGSSLWRRIPRGDVCERLWVIFCCGLRCMKYWACASHSRALGGEGQVLGQIRRRCQQLLVQGKGHASSIALYTSGRGRSEVSREAARISLIFSHMQDI